MCNRDHHLASCGNCCRRCHWADPASQLFSHSPEITRVTDPLCSPLGLSCSRMLLKLLARTTDYHLSFKEHASVSVSGMRVRRLPSSTSPRSGVWVHQKSTGFLNCVLCTELPTVDWLQYTFFVTRQLVAVHLVYKIPCIISKMFGHWYKLRCPPCVLLFWKFVYWIAFPYYTRLEIIVFLEIGEIRLL